MDKDDFKNFQSNLQRNEVFIQKNRFTIMLVLKTYKSAQFHELQSLMKITPGNLDHHLKILENNGFITRKTKIFSRKVGSNIEITKKGEEEIDNYLVSLKDILQKIDKE